MSQIHTPVYKEAQINYANIAFGIVGDDQSQWQAIDNFDIWYELTPIFFGDLLGHTSADLHLKAKYGLAWGNITEQTITQLSII